MNQQNPLLLPPKAQKSIQAFLFELKEALKSVSMIAFLTIMQSGPMRLEKRRYDKMIAKGETVWLDKLEVSPNLPENQKRPHKNEKGKLGNITPNQGKRAKKSRVIQLESYPEPVYPFSYKNPPLSGNVINGLDEAQKRPSTKLFHSNGYQIAWAGLERFFHAQQNMDSVASFRKILWRDRLRDGVSAQTKTDHISPDEMTYFVKEAAYAFGAKLVGITALKPEHCFDTFDPTPYPNAIAIALPMDLDGLRHATTEKSTTAVINAYQTISDVSVELAQRIRALGWQAQAAGNLGRDSEDVLHLPIAIEAGLGQLGKHGSIINKAYGSNLRFATVVTDLPLQHDSPEDIGVDDFCARCQICTTNCPPQAIFEEKQTVRGEEKWYVNFDKCVPYFAMHNSCGICVAVCPWTEPGQGEIISLKMLAQRKE